MATKRKKRSKKSGRVRTVAGPKKSQAGGRTVTIVRSGKPTDKPPRSKRIGAIRKEEPGQHRRTGLRLKGDVVEWMREGSHRLAMAACLQQGHVPVPCSACLTWADTVLTEALKEVGDV